MLMRFVGAIVARIGGDLPGGDAGPASRAAGDLAVKAEIIQVASEAQARGAVADDEVAMIESVVEFGDLTAGEIMTPRTDIVAVSAVASPQDARRAVVESGHTRLPVYEGGVDNVIGILHGKDLLAVDDLRTMDLRKMLRPPFFVPETKHLGELLREFKAGKLHMAIVLDEYGGTAGLVTIEDLLEEIVGEIADEYDLASTPLLRRIDERTVETDGRLRIAQLNDALGLHLPEGRDYDTVAGLVFSELGFIPPVGETLSSHGAKFTVIGADARKITRVRVELPGGEET
jgi:CBS domain containing-hemolysin-like protein